MLQEFTEDVRASFDGAFEIRWSAAEKKAVLQNILKHYKPLVKSLEIVGKPNGPFLDHNTETPGHKQMAWARHLQTKILLQYYITLWIY